MATVDPVLSSFVETVIEPISIVTTGATRTSAPLSYQEYLTLPADERSGDEAPVVDDQFARGLLRWLGWSPAHYRYNAPETGRGKSVQRPDFRVFSKGSTAFVIEDKASNVDWSLEHVPQLRKYASGTTGLALWTNLREIRLLRFQPDGSFKDLAVTSVEVLAGSGQPDLFSSDAAAIRSVYDLLNQGRFEEFEGLLEAATVDAPRIPLISREALDEFISGSHAVLSQVGRSATSQVMAAQTSWEERRQENTRILEELRAENEILLSLGWSEPSREKLARHLTEVEIKLGSLIPEDIELNGLMSVPERLVRHVERWKRNLLSLDTRTRNLEMARRGHSDIVDAFSLWLRLQPDQSPEVATVEKFSEQVSYILFVRLVLARILEDKLILPERIVANGGFDAWRRLVEERFSPGTDESATMYGEQFLNLLFRTVSSYYDHFFGQPVFDWYETDDFSLVSLLAHLNKYDFSEITNDVIGYTYEHYVDRRDKKSKGQFLTRAGLVDYVLERVGYEGPDIIGKRLLDHASGSGSFLIHAARVLRSTVAEAMERMQPGGYSADELLARRALTATASSSDSADEPLTGAEESGELRAARLEFAGQFLHLVSRDIVGMDIDPFACYLAELNLLVQVLDDLALFWAVGEESPLQRFQVFNSDGLTLPDRVLDSTSTASTLGYAEDADQSLDEGWAVKALDAEFATKFDYVVANPPYVTAKKQAAFTTAVRGCYEL